MAENNKFSENEMDESFEIYFEMDDAVLDRQFRDILLPTLRAYLAPSRHPVGATNQPPPLYDNNLFNRVNLLFNQSLRNAGAGDALCEYANTIRRRALVIEVLQEMTEDYLEGQEAVRLVAQQEKIAKRAARAERRRVQKQREDRSMYYRQNRIFEESFFDGPEMTYVHCKTKKGFIAAESTIKVENLRELANHPAIRVVKVNKKPTDKRWYPFLHIVFEDYFPDDNFEIIIWQCPRYIMGIRVYTHVGKVWKGSANVDQPAIMDCGTIGNHDREVNERGKPLRKNIIGVGHRPYSDSETPSPDTSESEPRYSDAGELMLHTQDFERRRRESAEKKQRDIAFRQSFRNCVPWAFCPPPVNTTFLPQPDGAMPGTSTGGITPQGPPKINTNQKTKPTETTALKKVDSDVKDNNKQKASPKKRPNSQRETSKPEKEGNTLEPSAEKKQKIAKKISAEVRTPPVTRSKTANATNKKTKKTPDPPTEKYQTRRD